MKTFNRREWLALASAAVGLPATASADSFSDRPLTIIVPAPAGGTADIAARAIQQPLGVALNTSVIVDNRGGANGVVAALATLAAKPDGLTLLMAYSGFSVMTPHLVKLPYDPIKDLQAVCNVYSAPQVLVVRSSLDQIKTAQDLIRYAKEHPGKLNYASAGNGSVQHIGTELFKLRSGTFITHIPYRGTAPMVADLLSGQVDLIFTTAPPLIPHIQSGRFRPLLVASESRLGSLPNVPTSTEVGLKNFDVASWFALYAHAKTPKPLIDKIASEVKTIMATPSFRERAASQGAEANYLGPAQMNAFATEDSERWKHVIEAAKIQAD